MKKSIFNLSIFIAFIGLVVISISSNAQALSHETYNHNAREGDNLKITVTYADNQAVVIFNDKVLISASAGGEQLNETRNISLEKGENRLIILHSDWGVAERFHCVVELNGKSIGTHVVGPRGSTGFGVRNAYNHLISVN